MYLFVTPSLPRFSLPSRERLQRLGSSALAALMWAIAITYTAGRLTRIGFEWARPHIAKGLHSLAIALDGGLLYPDQPEPDQPEPDPTPGSIFDAAIDRVIATSKIPVAVIPTPVAAPAKPRAARRRTTKAAPEVAA
jgi:hypothetical protein